MGHLVEINSAEENYFAYNLINLKGGKRNWQTYIKVTLNNQPSLEDSVLKGGSSSSSATFTS